MRERSELFRCRGRQEEERLNASPLKDFHHVGRASEIVAVEGDSRALFAIKCHKSGRMAVGSQSEFCGEFWSWIDGVDKIPSMVGYNVEPIGIGANLKSIGLGHGCAKGRGRAPVRQW